MNTKPNYKNTQSYDKTLSELNILNPTSEHATFKDIYSNQEKSTVSTINQTLSTKIVNKAKRHTPVLIKKIPRKLQSELRSVRQRINLKKPTYPKLSENELTTRLVAKQKDAQVSIVVPVYNNIEYTKQCVNALAQQVSDYNFEIVIVDDESTDSTKEHYMDFKGIRYIRNGKNLGFLLSCNAAIKTIKSQYTILLNNDTEVLAGWLDGLIRPLEEDSEVGLVGSKLIYSDGVLQEAGGILFSDANAWNYGNGKDPNDFEYNYVKQVDYVTGASMAFRTSDFKKLGYFDESLAPAYYEDVDFAMKTRQAGLKVVYNPFSQAIHYEGRTMGTDTSTGLKAYQAVNRMKVYKKWKTALHKEYTSGPSEILEARERNNTKRVLVCDIHVPFPDKDAGSVRMHAILTCLKELGYQVTFWSDTHCPLDKYTLDLQQRGIEVVYGSTTFESFIRQRKNFYDAVILSRPIVAPRYLPLIRSYSPRTKVIFDTVDLHYVRLSRQAEIEQDPGLASLASKWKIIEMGLIKKADTSLVVSTFELDELKKLLPTESVAIVSLIHELKVKDPKDFNFRHDIMFIGSYSHLPNKDGLNWFIDNVWPIVLKSKPELRLTIIGSNMPTDLFVGKKGVKVLGFVEDPSEYFQKSKVFIAPLRFGAGVKGKILQAIEYGLPVVTTRVGAEGMFLNDGSTAMVADKPEEFAQKVLELYSNKQKWGSISKASQTILTNHFSREVAKKQLSRLVESK